VDARPVLSDPDLLAVQPDLGEGRLIISFEATEEAGERYRAVTAANVGERIALLLEGHVANIWTIRSPLGRRGVADAQMPRDQARCSEPVGAGRSDGLRKCVTALSMQLRQISLS
jgi:preprotein translocase subunit SecD